MKNVLLLIDIQNDFIPEGTLAIKNGGEVVPIANQLMKSNFFDQVIATQDWHPKEHKSFASNNPGAQVGDLKTLSGLPQIMWPDHCVQGTMGAEFHKDLDLSKISRVFKKGMNPEIDSYSGFFDNGYKSATGLGEYLKSLGSVRLFIMGLATDYCVLFTCLDSRLEGFETNLIADGCRAVNLSPEDEKAALERMAKAGVKILTSIDITEKTSA